MRRLQHPSWVHLPALAIWAWVLVSLVRAWPSLPARVPMHYGADGTVNRWGSPWELAFVAVVMPLFFLALGVLADEQWARQERGRRFNWATLFDEVTIGFLGAILLDQLALIHRGAPYTFRFPTALALTLVVGGGLAAALLELLRPFNPAPEALPPETAQAVEALAARVRPGERWVYLEHQNPVWVSLLSLGLGLVLLVNALLTWRAVPGVSLVLAASSLLCFPTYGGLRVCVTTEHVEVRLGILGLRLLRVPLEEIEGVAVRSFSPLAEFGGWGIRWNGREWAFFFRGTRGVEVQARSGKRWLIGSDEPERLAAVISAARGEAPR